MKQGSGISTKSARKVEPRAHAVSPAGVSQMGEALGNHATDSVKNLHGASEPLYKGKGFEAPKDQGRTIHHGGSQGRHD